MSVEGDCRIVKSFPGWIPYFEASNLRKFAEVFLEKLNLPEFLIAIASDSLTLIFVNIILAMKHSYLFRRMKRILKVESEIFCRRDGTRIVSRENSCSTSWLVVYFLWLSRIRASVTSIECIWQRCTSWISLQAF